MTLTYVDREGNSASVESTLSIREMLTIRHEESLSWYNYQKPTSTIAGRAGLNYTQMESLRRSRTWHEEATLFIEDTGGLEQTDTTLAKLGYMAGERKSQPQKGNRNGGKKNGGMSKASYQEFGELVITELVQTDHLKVPEDKMVTMEWAKNSWGIVKGAFNASDAELPALPDKPKSLTASEKNAELQSEVERLRAEIEALKSAKS